MSRFKIYALIGAILFTALVVTAIRIVGDKLVAPEEITPPAPVAQEPARQPEAMAEAAPAAEKAAEQVAKAVVKEAAEKPKAEKPKEVAAVVAGDPAAGKTVFKKHLCFACHKLDPGKHGAGPSLAGFWGKPAGTIDGFSYSDALKESGIVWDAKELDPWLLNPKKMVGGTKMILAKPVKSAADRANLIAYLKQVASP